MDELLQRRIEIQARKSLLSSVKSDTPSIEQILSLDGKEFSFLVDEIIKSESKAVTIAFREKESIILPAFGYFKFKPAKEKVFEEIRKILAVYGYNKMSDIRDPMTRALIMQNIQPIIKQIYLDTVVIKPHKTEVLGNIFKK